MIVPAVATVYEDVHADADDERQQPDDANEVRLMLEHQVDSRGRQEYA